MPARDARNRTDRLDVLARMLSDRPGITTSELARELDVSARSIFRDIDVLRARGYPVESSRGRGGGLRLHPNWGLGKLVFSREEALCTLLSLAVTARLGLPMFAPELARARRKIADAFPRAERRRLGPLRERIFIGKPASLAVQRSYDQPATGAMRKLQVAFVDEHTVRVEYVKESGERTIRRLEPHALVINWPAWYVVAHDHTRGEPRTFRLDRFMTVEVESQHFRPRAHDVLRPLLSETGVLLERV